ncbi:MAG TPA: hypothetical protein VHL59_00700 [Thermoanaerobaculia bacterium]|nr:hypothetical protein [Thermoanaerobaculia bacterium]
MTAENPLETSEIAAPRRVYRPADYYSSATPPPILPRWAPFGCGAASVVILIVVFAGGAFLAGGGFTDFMDLVFGMTMGEMRGMYAADVTDAQKKELEREIETLREHLRNERIAAGALDPVLQAMRRATADEKLARAEVEKIVAAARRINSAAKAR